jgi:hypothetical protein
MKIPFFSNLFYFFLVSSFLISGVSAVTITGATFTDALTPGETISHTMNLKADNPAEIGKVFAVTIAGNGSQWVTVDKTSITVSNDSAPVTATVKIPNDGMNGAYQANILYTAPAGGMVQYQLRVPVHIVITGGKEPTPTPAAAISRAPVEVTKEEITNVQTQEPTQKMGTVSAQTPAPVTTTETTQAPQETPTRADIPIWAFVVVGLGVVGIIVLGVVLYSERRG